MLLFILISGIFLFSCEKDKETENPDADDNTEDPVPEDPDSSDSFGRKKNMGGLRQSYKKQSPPSAANSQRCFISL